MVDTGSIRWFATLFAVYALDEWAYTALRVDLCLAVQGDEAAALRLVKAYGVTPEEIEALHELVTQGGCNEHGGKQGGIGALCGAD